MTAPEVLPAAEMDPDHRVQLEAVYWCFVGIATLSVILRIWARVFKRILGVDDWLMVACWVRTMTHTSASALQGLTFTQLCFIVTGVLVTFITETGGTRHKTALTTSELESQIKLQAINLIFWIATTLLGKMAIGLAILRILNKAKMWHTWPVYIVMHFMNVISILDTLLILFRCGNPENLWNTREQPTCLDQDMVYKFNLFAAACQVFVDFFLAFFPMYIVSRLQMPLRRKCTIMTLLGLTTLTGVAASVKIAVTQTSLGDMARDSTWDFFLLSICTATQIMLLIVCGSVPTMVPLWNDLVKSHHMGSSSTSRAMSGAKYSKPEDSELRQTKQSIKADVDNIDLEALAELPSSVSHTRVSLRYPLPSKAGMFDRLSGRFHLREKSWGIGEGEGASERHCDDSAV